MSEVIIDNIYISERIHDKYGYCQSDSIDYNRYPYVRSDFPKLSEKELDNVRKELGQVFNNIAELGIWELSVLSYIFPVHQHNINTIVGTRGCGKTAFSKNLYTFLKKHTKNKTPKERPILLYIDFNDYAKEYLNSITNERKEIIKILSDEIFHQLMINYWIELKSFIEKYLDNNHHHKYYFIETFLRKIRNLDDKSDFFDEVTEVWYNLTSSKQFSPQTALASSLSLVGEIVSLSNTKFVYFCIDNIDPLSPSCQNDIHQALLALVNKSRIPIFVPARIITAKHNNIQQYQNKTIPHSGIVPLKEIKRRGINSIIEIFGNPDLDIFTFPYLSLKEKFDYVIKTVEIFKCLDTNRDFNELFESVVGYSIERGMSFIKRCYLASDKLIDYKEIASSEHIQQLKDILLSNNYNNDKKLKIIYLFIKTLYKERNIESPQAYQFIHEIMRKCLIKSDDFGIILEDIYSSPVISSTKISTIKYRILSYLKHLEWKYQKPCRISDIIKLCNNYYFTEDEILESINQLHDPNKRLIYNTGRNQYKSFNQLYDNRFEEVGITYIGLKYINNLSLSLDYIGFTLSSSESDYNNIQSSNLTNRITFIMRLMYEALSDEFKYDKYVNDNSLKISELEFSVLAKHWAKPIQGCINILRNHKNNIKESKRALSEFSAAIEQVFNLHDGYLKNFHISNLKVPAEIKRIDYHDIIDDEIIK